jgi:phosphohistidine swiveling domain-containing protein
MELLRNFKELSKSDVGLAGGKGASLGEMTKAGIPVPPGFVILSASFEKFIQETELVAEIDAILESVHHEEIHTVENASEKIQALILAAKMPKDIEKAIAASFKELDAKYIAVRSSATAEDSASAAWAGQLDSYLNTTEKKLLENVKRCWASLFTPRAIFYRFEQGLHEQKISVAVVVQKMLESEVSGVAFSVHPVTQDRNQLIIEGSYGLGEAIVSGQVTPDSYVVEKQPRRIIERMVQAKTRGIYRSVKNGNDWKDIPAAKAEKQALSDKQILELAELVLHIERHYGFPCDIEWALEKGKFYIVQSRPITTLNSNSHPESITTSLREKYHLDGSTWTYKGFHGVLHPFFPVGETGIAMRDFFGDAASIVLFFVQNDYAHWYWNDNDLTRIREEFLRRLKKDKRYLEKLKNAFNARIKAFAAVLKHIDKTNLKKLSDEKIAKVYDNFYRRYVDEFKYFMVLGDAVSMHADRYLTPEFEKILGKDFAVVFPKLLTPRYLSFIEEEGIARAKLIKTFRKTHKLDRKVLERHANHFFYIHNNYAKGVRLTAADFVKMIREDAKKDIESAQDRRKKLLIEKAKLIKQYKLSPWHKTLLYIMDEFFELQDTRKKYVLISNYYQFQFLKEAARRGGIPFGKLCYSIYPEFRRALAGDLDEKMLDARRVECVCIHTKDGFEVVSGAPARDALDFFQQKLSATKEIRGMVASGGTARGRVKKILKIHDMANMEKGDILVSSMTRPEMAPVMKLAAAIVTDEGGVTSHAAIVSREMGIPCIIGTKIATRILKDGDLVEVDADKGVVRILNKK